MIVSESRGYISKYELLSKIPEYDIYRKYLGFDFKPYKNYYSPFRQEKEPSFGMFITKEGYLYFKDLGGDGFGGDCVKFVSLLFKISYYQALQKIKDDFNFDTGAPPVRPESEILSWKPKTFTRIQIIPKKFLTDELAYWNQYGIDRIDLKRENIFSVGHLYISKKKIPIGKSMVFAYLYQDHDKEYLKIYQPFEKLHKWYSNVPVKRPLNLDSLEHISKAVILAKSKKDKIVLNKLLTDIYETQKEGSEVVPDELNNYFDEYYDNKFVFFDNDITGVKTATSLTYRGFKPIFIPPHFQSENIKDPSDFVKKYGYTALEMLLSTYGLNFKKVTW